MSKKVYLGVSNSWYSGASLVTEDGKILFSANEERFNRKKLTSDYPKETLKEIEKIIKKEGYKKAGIIRGGIINYFNKSKELNEIFFKNNFLFTKLEYFTWLIDIIRNTTLFLSKIIPSSRFKKIDHHLCHAAGAYYTQNKKKALIITTDAYGDGSSASVAIGKDRNIKFIKKYGWESTPAHLYSRITQLLGFKSHKHEGKITGLAGYGKPTCYSEMKKLISIDNNAKIKSKSFLRAGFNQKKLKKIFGNYKKEDIACSLQKITEEITCKFVSFWVDKTGIKDLVVAGGLFANVKLNQLIHELPNVNNIYVFPHMGDGGLALGACLAHTKPTPKQLETPYLGPSYSDKEIKKALDKSGIKYKKYNNIEKEIAKLLSKGKVIARFNEAMEYGPRALGNRSILYQTTDKTVNEWLNKKLKRTEFMPFAPATMWEHKDECYKKMKGAENTARYMTICFNTTKKMQNTSPGVVHIDGTARPQIVRKKDNQSFHKIIHEYYKITNNPSIINTSFNMHEEPIINNPKQAIKAYKESKIDNLAIGKYLI